MHVAFKSEKNICSNQENIYIFRGIGVKVTIHYFNPRCLDAFFFVFSGLPFCEACGWSAVEQLAEVQVLRLTMELALARAEAGDTVRADDSDD